MLEWLGSKHHQNGFIGDFQHLMPVFGREQKTLVRRIEDKMLLFGAGVIGNKTTSFQTNDRLFHRLVVSGIFEMIGTINVKNTLDFERDYALDHGQATAGVRKGFQIN